MNPLIKAIIRIGEGADRVAGPIRSLPGRLRTVAATARYRRSGILAALAMLAFYLFAIGDISLALDGRYAASPGSPSAEVAANWPDRVFSARAPLLYEPVLAVFPLPQLALLLSPVNIALGGTLATLFGLNVMVTAYAVFHSRSCRVSSFSRLLGALPGFLVGFACCVPTFVLVLGTGVAAALIPALVPVRSFLLPFSLALMTATLLWGANFSTPQDPARAPRARPRTPPRRPALAVESASPPCHASALSFIERLRRIARHRVRQWRHAGHGVGGPSGHPAAAEGRRRRCGTRSSRVRSRAPSRRNGRANRRYPPARSPSRAA